MSIEDILDDMDELLDQAGAVPFAPHKSIIDGERLRELINDVRMNAPQELKNAKMIEYDRERILKEASTKAEQVVRQAEERARALVSQEAIIKEAKKRAVEAMTRTRKEIDEQKANADTYVAQRYKEIEDYFTRTLQEVQANRRASERTSRASNAAAKKSADQAKTLLNKE